MQWCFVQQQHLTLRRWVSMIFDGSLLQQKLISVAMQLWQQRTCCFHQTLWKALSFIFTQSQASCLYTRFLELMENGKEKLSSISQLQLHPHALHHFSCPWLKHCEMLRWFSWAKLLLVIFLLSYHPQIMWRDLRYGVMRLSIVTALEWSSQLLVPLQRIPAMILYLAFSAPSCLSMRIQFVAVHIVLWLHTGQPSLVDSNCEHIRHQKEEVFWTSR